MAERVYRAVSFDVWDTIFKIRPVYRAVAEALSRRVGLPTDELYARLIEAGRELRRLRRNRGFIPVEEALEVTASKAGVHPGTLRAAVAEVFASVDPSSLLIDGVLEALREVLRRGVKAVVLSNVLYWPGSYTRLLLARAGILDYFADSVFADEIGTAKPSREAFERAAERAGCSVEELIHVGDRVDEDFGGALAAGAAAVLVGAPVKGVVRVHRRAFALESVGLLGRVLELLEKEGVLLRQQH